MDNHGTPAPSNFHIRWYVAYQKNQDPSKCWPFEAICEYSRNIDLSCRVPLSNRRGRKIVEAPESSARRNTEAENVVDENNRAIPIVTSSGSETDSSDDAAYEAERRRKGKAAADENSSDIEIDIPRGSETDSDEDAGAENEYNRQLNVAIHESLKSCNTNIAGVTLDTHALRTVTGLAKEFDFLMEGVTQPESEAAEGNVGNIGNDSASNPVMELANIPHCPNEDGVDEGAQIEVLDAVRGYELVVCNGNGTRSESEADIGKFISDTEPTDSIPHPRVSRCGRPIKPTYKLLKLPNAGEGTSRSKRTQPKRRRLNGSGVGGKVGVSEPNGSGFVVVQAGRANGVARQADVFNPDESGVGVEVGGSGPSEPTSVAVQASGVDDVRRETDMVVPFHEPMVCVTNRNPMDLSIKEAKKYMRTE